MRRECEKAKRALSVQTQTTIEVCKLFCKAINPFIQLHIFSYVDPCICIFTYGLGRKAKLSQASQTSHLQRAPRGFGPIT